MNEIQREVLVITETRNKKETKTETHVCILQQQQQTTFVSVVVSDDSSVEEPKPQGKEERKNPFSLQFFSFSNTKKL